MKNSFKFFIAVFAILVSQQSFAQSVTVKGGYTLSNLLVNEENRNTESARHGFHLGVSAEVPLYQFLSFEPGMEFTTKGAKQSVTLIGAELASTYNLYYIDFPLRVKASYGAVEGVKVFGAAGPYLGVGLAGKLKEERKALGVTVSTDNDIKWSNKVENSDPTLRRLDAGLSFAAGIEIKSISIGVSYDLGLSNMFPKVDGSDLKMSNGALKATVGYRIGF